jgi:hypothetical protein
VVYNSNGEVLKRRVLPSWGLEEEELEEDEFFFFHIELEGRILLLLIGRRRMMS